MPFKQPRSVQVVIFAESLGRFDFLLLRRVRGHGPFWQSVTGSLEEGETHRQAAVREVWEETGIRAGADELMNLGVVNTFEIAPRWRLKYSPGVTHNEEVCFALRVERCEVRIDPREHDDSIWVDYETALSMLFWESNKRAFAALAAMLK